MGTSGTARRMIHSGADLVAATAVAASTVVLFAVRALTRRRFSDGVPRMLTLEADYSLATIRERELEQLITARDLDGFFDHVWSVHPTVGADAGTEQLAHPPTGRVSCTAVSTRHTMVEAKVGRYRKLISFPMLNFSLSQRALLTTLDRLIRREGINMVRASDPFYLAPLGLILARSNRLPFVVRLIANYDMSFYAEGRPAYPRLFRSRAIEQRVGRFVLRHADLVAAGNEDVAKYAISNGAPPERTTTFMVGNLIERLHFEMEPTDRTSVNYELGLGDRPFIVCVARLERIKHPEDFVDVLAEVRLTDPTVAGVLVGDGSMCDELQALALRLGVADDLIFAGNRDQQWVARALSSARVIVSPLTGRSLVEGALSATPIVAYDTDWQSELVKDGVTGVLVPYRDTHQMAAGVTRLLNDTEYSACLGRQARAYALETMDPQRLDNHERREYEKLLASSQRVGRREPPPASQSDDE